ncbi:hypothetical protein BDA99DRAFT_538749 [Phascolomyces articulosus]|uniref:Uncharacterized protein n=1 Tax=Phascolomyces articulosus TaxID=60185 RepID=A0AAD5JXD4_9FUNG|nr:hypothetical protein BDA99DRAFT_538749 [Phascolomyces articulosus]
MHENKHNTHFLLVSYRETRIVVRTWVFVFSTPTVCGSNNVYYSGLPLFADYFQSKPLRKHKQMTYCIWGRKLLLVWYTTTNAFELEVSSFYNGKLKNDKSFDGCLYGSLVVFFSFMDFIPRGSVPSSKSSHASNVGPKKDYLPELKDA